MIKWYNLLAALMLMGILASSCTQSTDTEDGDGADANLCGVSCSDEALSQEDFVTVKAPQCGTVLNPGEQVTVQWDADSDYVLGIQIRVIHHPDSSARVLNTDGRQFDVTAGEATVTIPSDISCCDCALSVEGYSDNSIRDITYFSTKEGGE